MKIFVTIATHEQPFNRLMADIESIDQDSKDYHFFVQYGYSRKPEGENIETKKFLTYSQMQEKYKWCDCVITHAGPASVFDALSTGILPIVVPRYHDLNEHVNNHQVEFTKFLQHKNFPIIAVYEKDSLKDAINQFKEEKVNTKFISHKKEFNQSLQSIIDQMFVNGGMK